MNGPAGLEECLFGMQAAQKYRERAAHLRQLASDESDVPLRQQLALEALRCDQFAQELEEGAETVGASETRDP